MTKTKQDLSKHVHTPLDVANAGYNEAERIQNSLGMGISFPDIPGTDAATYIARFMPWEIIAVMGQTHNGKSLFFDWLETGIAEGLVKENRPDEVIVHVSHEESLEAMSFQQHSKYSGIPVEMIASGQADLKKLKISTNKIAGINIYRIARSAQTDESAPPLTTTNIYRLLLELANGNVTGSPVKIAAVFDDYLQAHPYDDEVKRKGGEDKRRLQVREDVFRMREMVTRLQAPIFLGVQAKQKLTNPRPPFYIPGIYDGEESSSIAQRPDRIMSIWMPKVDSYSINEMVPGIGIITEEMFWLKMLKQRGGLPSGKSWKCAWDYKNHTLAELL